ncbi:MAG TPA: hypothetical protein VJU84_13090 [Pyrinomonadaceae bacterium]|nr:hypothetical protein [Pyrinomonadaceae bacterium]
MTSRLTAHRLLVITIITVVSFTIAGAQSGRKSPRSAPLPPVPMPTPETTAPVSKEKAKAKPALTVVVGFERMNYYGNAAMVDEGAALRALVDRLNDHAGVEVADTKRNMTRSDALRAAKGEKEAFVIYVEISLDQMDGDLRMSYWVYSPQTAKIKTSGRTYPQMYRSRGVILNPRSTVYGTRQMEEAGRDVAERILRAFQLHLPSERSVT